MWGSEIDDDASVPARRAARSDRADSELVTLTPRTGAGPDTA
jgi:hypothetical protein